MKNLFVVIAAIFLTQVSFGETLTEFIKCASKDKQYNSCGIDKDIDGDISEVRLFDQISSADCDDEFGVKENRLYVDNGCRAIFEIEISLREYGRNTFGEEIVRLTCSSFYRERNECYVGNINRVQMLEQLSRSDCDEDDEWWVKDGKVIVDKGCRATFQVTID
jgi:hypothetical protein